eukprot:TRINITY_DN21913_c0_g1_i2.p1 TRINITY_DN21913_c0_g1~~TRINITY_DN21913_c0_g1_i2.p1  ORF type:complete len:594 (-),score=99.83 TRINITY_DN21913_c0_g1_i2:492-2273(-)
MRDYESGNWGFALIWGIRASVFPRAFAMALPNAALAFLLAYAVKEEKDKYETDVDTLRDLFGYFTSIQFFVLFFRSNVAYSRWWEGGTLLQQVRGEWFNAYSSLIAMSSTKPEDAHRVEAYHHQLARFMSLLLCCALQQVSPYKSDRPFEIFDVCGLDRKSLLFLEQAADKVEIILQWIQRSISLNVTSGVLPIPPPILSRAYQEISRGIVNLQNARKIADFPFPYPYAQASMVMLLIHWAMCPITSAMLLSPPLAAFLSFNIIFFLWCINFIALQLEMPFGDADNDLPMEQFQHDWNKSIGTLLAKRAQYPPVFDFQPERDRLLQLVMSDGSEMAMDHPDRVDINLGMEVEEVVMKKPAVPNKRASTWQVISGWDKKRPTTSTVNTVPSSTLNDQARKSHHSNPSPKMSARDNPGAKENEGGSASAATTPPVSPEATQNSASPTARVGGGGGGEAIAGAGGTNGPGSGGGGANANDPPKSEAILSGSDVWIALPPDAQQGPPQTVPQGANGTAVQLQQAQDGRWEPIPSSASPRKIEVSPSNSTEEVTETDRGVNKPMVSPSSIGVAMRDQTTSAQIRESETSTGDTGLWPA